MAMFLGQSLPSSHSTFSGVQAIAMIGPVSSQQAAIISMNQRALEVGSYSQYQLEHAPLCIRLTWLVDCSLQMMKKRHKIERDLSIGEEVGWSKNQEVAKTNPTLAAMNKKFGMIHGLSSLANIMSFGSLAMHSWYLASKLEL
jgi:hypothetical protein